MSEQSGSAKESLLRHPLIVGLVIAVIGAAATIIGVVLNNGSSSNGSTSNAKPPAATPAQTSSAIPPGSTSPAPSTQPSTVVSTKTTTEQASATRTLGGVWHRGSLTIAAYTEADLDSPATDPTWGEAKLPNGANYDLTFNGGLLEPVFSAQYKTQILVADGAGAPSCQTQSGYGTQSVDLTTLKIGTYLCAITSEGRFAQIRFVKFPKVNQPVTFNVIVFNL